MSGIGPLSARNFDGRGIRVVVVGDKGKGDAELYDSQEVSGGVRNGDLSWSARGMQLGS